METKVMYLQPKWLNVKQVAVQLGYSVSKVRTLIKTRQLKSVKDGGNRRVLPQWVDEYIASKTAEIDHWELAA